jgi:hypothetical protein
MTTCVVLREGAVWKQDAEDDIWTLEGTVEEGWRKLHNEEVYPSPMILG